MQHNKPTHIVLTTYTALGGLHETAYAVLIKQRHNIYMCVHAYTSRHSMRKIYRNSMMILIRNSIMIIYTGALIL